MAQILNKKNTRKISESTGLDIIRAWSFGGVDFSFVTRDHRHGVWNKKTQEWEFEDKPIHFTSCHELFDSWERGF